MTELVLRESNRLRDLIDAIGEEAITPDQEQELARILAEDNGLVEVGTAVFDLKLAMDRCEAIEKRFRAMRKRFEESHDYLRAKASETWKAAIEKAGIDQPEPMRLEYFTQSYDRGRENVTVAPGCSLEDVDPLYVTSEQCETCGGTGRIAKVAKERALVEFTAKPPRPVAGLAYARNPFIVQRATAKGKMLKAEIELRGFLPHEPVK